MLVRFLCLSLGKFLFVGLIAGVLLVACSSGGKSVGNQPTAPVASAGDTQPARLNEKTGNAVYNVPVPADPRGQVVVNSVGIADLSRAGSKTKAKFPTLHVQLLVKNDTGLGAWTIDSRLQQVRFDVSVESGESASGTAVGSTAGSTTGSTAGTSSATAKTKARAGEGLRPTFVSAAKGDALPFVKIAPGQTKKIELFYALPADQRGTLDHQNFAIDWQLIAGNDVINNSTVFSSIAQNQESISVAAAKDKNKKPATSVTSPPDARAAGVMMPAGLENDWWQNPAATMPATWRGF